MPKGIELIYSPMQNKDIAKMYVNDIKTTTVIVASNSLYDGMIIPWYSSGPNLGNVTPNFLRSVAEYGYIYILYRKWSKIISSLGLKSQKCRMDLYEFVWVPPMYICKSYYGFIWICFFCSRGKAGDVSADAKGQGNIAVWDATPNPVTVIYIYIYIYVFLNHRVYYWVARDT